MIGQMFAMDERYSKKFYRKNWRERNAQIIVPEILRFIKPRKVLDVGCNVGHFLKQFKKYGAKIKGIDGSYVPLEDLLIPKKSFTIHDLKNPIDIKEKFDLVVCLEVAEHLPKGRGESFIKELTMLAPVIVFSAAIPGQGGTHHINEQWHSYWVRIFKKYEYIKVDCIRPLIWNMNELEKHYKQNMFFFVRQRLLNSYPELQEAYESTKFYPVDVVHPDMFRHDNLKTIPLKRAVGTILLFPIIIYNSIRRKK